MATAFNAQLNVQLNAQSLNTASKEIRQSLGRITGSASEFQKSLDASTARVFAFGATTLVINGITQSFKALVATTIDVEKKLIEIDSIFGGTASQFASFRDSIFNVAKSTGQSFSVVADGAAEFARQGLSATETAKRLEAALILTRVSGLDSVKSVNALTSAINGFTSAGLTAAQITNKLVAVDTAFAVSAQDLAEGFSRAGSTAEDAGVSFDELLGIITAVQQKTARGGAVIGNALKSVFTRLSRSSTIADLQELGVAIDSSQSGIQKLQALSNALQQISDPNQASAIKELAGGVYQINIVSAALKDLSSQSSIFSQATATSAKATNEAYSKNEQLNKSLAAQINQLIAGVTNLAEKAGQLTFAPLLSNLVGIATKISEFFDKALDPEKGNAFIQGIFKAIGAFISGPGLVLVTGAFLRIVSLVTKFAKEGFESVMKIGSAEEKIQKINSGITRELLENEKFRKAILDKTLTQEQKEQLINKTILERNKLYNDQKMLIEAISRVALKSGVTGYESGVGYVNKRNKPIVKARGFAPSFAETVAETSAAREHGYTAGKVYNTRLHDGSGGSFKATVNSAETIKTVRGANGKLGTYVIPPNGFAGKGFVPNYADISKETSTRNLLSIINNKSGRKTPAEVEAAKNRLGQLQGNQVSINKILASQGIKKLPTVLTPNIDGIVQKTKKNFMGTGKDASYLFKVFPIKKSGINQLENDVEKDFSDKAIDDFATTRALRLAQSVSLAVGSNPATPETLDKVDGVKGFRGAIRSAFGSLFDAALTTGLGLSSSQKDGGDFDVRLGTQKDPKQTLKNIRTLFGSSALGSKGLADFKIGGGDTTAESMIRKTNNEYGSLITKGMGLKNKAAGFVPNFAPYVYDSDRIPADKGATLKAILASKAKKNLLIAPSGAGKSTAAAKLGKFLTGASDVSKASEINLLSGAARAKGGGMSKQLESLLDSVNASGGKVSYLHVKNMEIMKRRMGRASLEGDLRSEKQLKGTKFAPLNQFDFVKAVKSRAKRFEVLNAGGGFVPNFVGKLIGTGAKASFYKTDKKTGVKKFNDNVGTSAIANEWLASQFVNRELKYQGADLRAPQIYGGLQEAIKTRQIKKEFIEDPVARSVIDPQRARDFGTNVLHSILAQKGMVENDLHGGNYTVDKTAENYINGLTNYSGTTAKGRIRLIDLDESTSSGGQYGAWRKAVLAKMEKGNNKAGGFVPNFSAVGDAINREKAAGVPSSKIYLDSSPQLKSSRNPMGMMVANSLDEPSGGFQGINRARKEGRNPKTYGAAGGFVPNYAAISIKSGEYGTPDYQALNKLNSEAYRLSEDFKSGAKTLEKVKSEFQELAKQAGLSEEVLKRISKEGDDFLSSLPKINKQSLGTPPAPPKLSAPVSNPFDPPAPPTLSAPVSNPFAPPAPPTQAQQSVPNRPIFTPKKITPKKPDVELKIDDSVEENPLTRRQKIKKALTSGKKALTSDMFGGKGGDVVSKTQAGLGKFNENLGKTQGALFALSIASSALAGDNEKLAAGIQKVISGISILTVIGPMMSGLVPLLANPVGLLAAAVIGAAATIIDSDQKLKAAQQEDIFVSAKVAKQKQGIEYGREIMDTAISNTIGETGKNIGGYQLSGNDRIRNVEAELTRVAIFKNDSQKVQLARDAVKRQDLAKKSFREENIKYSEKSSRLAVLSTQRIGTDRGPSQEEKVLAEELKDAEKKIKSASLELEYSMRNVAYVLSLSGEDLNSSLNKTIKDLDSKLSSFASVIDKINQDIVGATTSSRIAGGVELRQGSPLGEQVATAIKSQQNKVELLGAKNSFASSFSGIKGFNNAESFKGENVGSKIAEDMAKEFSAASGGKELTAEESKKIEEASTRAQNAENERAAKAGIDSLRKIFPKVNSQGFQSEVLGSYSKDGIEGIKKSFADILPKNLSKEQAQEFYDKIASSADLFLKASETSYQNAVNTESRIRDSLTNLAPQLRSAMKESLTGLPTELKGILSGDNLDIGGLSAKAKEAGDLNRKGDKVGAAKILADIEGQLTNLDKLAGAGSSAALLERSGISLKQKESLTEAGKASKIDFTSISSSVQKALGENSYGSGRVNKAIEAAQSDPSKISNLIAEIQKQLGSGRNSGLSNQLTSGLSSFQTLEQQGKSVNQIESKILRAGSISGDNTKVSEAIKAFKESDPDDNKAFEKLKQVLEKNVRYGAGTDAANQLRGAAIAEKDRKTEEGKDPVKELETQQTKLNADLVRAQEDVKKFGEIMAATGLKTEIDNMTIVVRKASENLNGFEKLTGQFSSLNDAISGRMKNMEEAIRKLQSVTPNP